MSAFDFFGNAGLGGKASHGERGTAEFQKFRTLLIHRSGSFYMELGGTMGCFAEEAHLERLILRISRSPVDFHTPWGPAAWHQASMESQSVVSCLGLTHVECLKLCYGEQCRAEFHRTDVLSQIGLLLHCIETERTDKSNCFLCTLKLAYSVTAVTALCPAERPAECAPTRRQEVSFLRLSQTGCDFNASLFANTPLCFSARSSFISSQPN